jgi:nucleoside-diphosphate-sugar epimerase
VKIALTGAGGFIGSVLQPALEAAGHDIRPAVESDAIVHLAAIAHRRGVSSEDLQRVNVDLAQSVARTAADRGARMIFMSSVKVHGEAGSFTEGSPFDPKDAYADSKVRAERMLRAMRGLRLTVLRPPLVYGPGVKANFRALMAALARGLPLPLASVANRRSLIYVGNIADAVVRCLASPQSAGRTYLVSDGAPVSTPDLCRSVASALGRKARLFPFPPGLIPARSLVDSLVVDDAAIRSELKWRAPYSFEQGLKATADWYLGR